ncbi:MAG: SufD family Fe-S cluster assembly protein [Fibrobacteres bacterium]|jgi:Fe-S cluster assembly protein SufD|nr:SufD family Fe-S cluster assembly protein [Fibrobacterota bacterium]
MNAPTASQPRIMREVIAPTLTPVLEGFIEQHLETSPPVSAGVRLAAAMALRRIGLPHSGSEDFSFIRVGDFLSQLVQVPVLPAPAVQPSDAKTPEPATRDLPSRSDLASLISPAAENNLVVLIDGVFVPELSRIGEDYFVSPLEDSAPPDSPIPGMHLRFQGLHASFVNRIENMLEEENDAPAALAALFAPQPLLIRVPAKRVAAGPLQILYLTTGTQRSDSFVVVHAGAQSESRILVRHARLGTSPDGKAPGMENAHTMAVLEDGASLRFLELGIDSPSAAQDIHLRKLTVRLERDARLVAVSAHTGSRLTRTAFGIDLAGEGADAELNGAAVLSGARQGHQHVRLRHLVPHGTSRQLFKTVAAEQGRASVDGTIIVALDAQQTNAGQRIHNLMLSDEARADSKPRLMIHADDVKCSHGATAGKLDPAQQYYLESRGLPPDQARSLLTVAFVAEALDKAGNPGDPFRDALDHALLDGLRARLPGVSPGAITGGPHA